MHEVKCFDDEKHLVPLTDSAIKYKGTFNRSLGNERVKPLLAWVIFLLMNWTHRTNYPKLPIGTT